MDLGEWKVGFGDGDGSRDDGPSASISGVMVGVGVTRWRRREELRRDFAGFIAGFSRVPPRPRVVRRGGGGDGCGGGQSPASTAAIISGKSRWILRSGRYSGTWFWGFRAAGCLVVAGEEAAIDEVDQRAADPAAGAAVLDQDADGVFRVSDRVRSSSPRSCWISCRYRWSGRCRFWRRLQYWGFDLAEVPPGWLADIDIPLRMSSNLRA